MTQPIQQLQTGEIVSRGRIFERPFSVDGKIHYFQIVSVLDGYAQAPANGHEGMVAITHETEIEVDPPANPRSY